MDPKLNLPDSFYRAIFESSPSLLLVLSPDLEIIEGSDAYLSATMTRREEIVGRHLFEVFPDNPDDPEATGTANLRTSLDTVLASGRAHTMALQKYDIRKPDGTFEIRFWSPINAPVLGRDGRVEFIVHRVEDVTQFVRDQDLLREQNEQISAELFTRMQELDASNRALMASEREAAQASAFKSEFLSRMSHELRTPLNAILGFTQLMQMKHDDPRLEEPLTAITRAGRHLLVLINETLDLTSIEAGTMTISVEPVQLAQAVQSAVDIVHPLASSAGISITIDVDTCEDAHVMADRHRLTQVLINLVNNAIKYNRPKGSIRVWCGEGLNGIRWVRVKDTGLGIAKADQPRLFQPFQRFGPPSIEGTGLGLAVSSRCVDLMGGTLALVESSSDGSTFQIELPGADAPYKDVSRMSALRDGHNAPLTEGQTVLYIEDNLSNLRLLELLFSEWPSLRLVPAMLGQLGLDLAHELQPDLILLDLHLPDLGGREVLQKLKSDPETAGIPVVIVSADALPSQVKQLLADGAAEYITKPIDMAAFMAAMGRHLGSAGEV